MFRAEVIGSLLRPSYLKEARAAFERGELAASDFKRVEDRAVDQVIAVQEGAGVDVVTDGEMRRFLFMGPITEVVDGITPVEHGNAMPWNSPEGELDWVFPGRGHVEADQAPLDGHRGVQLRPRTGAAAL